MRAKGPWRDVRLAVRKDDFRRLGRERFGVTTDVALAACLGMRQPNLSRLFKGDVQASGPLIAALLTALDATFEEVFEVRVIEHEPAEPIAQAA